MGTSIHAHTPPQARHLHFHFDEEYVQKCLNASNATVLSNCAGSGYFVHMQKFFKDHYLLYDNGCEGIRNGCEENNVENVCSCHQSHPTSKGNSGWRGIQLQRVPPPVPDYSLSDFHYCSLKQMRDGDKTEKFDLDKEKVMNVRRREIDDYCPRQQLDNLMTRCGEPSLKSQKKMKVTEVFPSQLLIKMIHFKNTTLNLTTLLTRSLEKISGK